jgi:hypothetical protein
MAMFLQFRGYNDSVNSPIADGQDCVLFHCRKVEKGVNDFRDLGAGFRGSDVLDWEPEHVGDRSRSEDRSPGARG